MLANRNIEVTSGPELNWETDLQILSYTSYSGMSHFIHSFIHFNKTGWYLGIAGRRPLP